MFAFLVDLGQLIEMVDLLVDPHARETSRFQIEEELAVLALAMGNEGREQRELRPRRKTEHFVRDLFRCLRAHEFAADVAMLLSHLGVQDAQIVVDLGDRSDDRTRVARSALLFDRDRGQQSTQVLNSRTLELPEELPRVSGKLFYVAPLALGVERVEREARLSRPAHTDEDDELAFEHFEPIDVEVVLPRAEHLDAIKVLSDP